MDSTVRDDLERCLPETEPPMRLRLEDVTRRGRRRRRMLTLSPASAAAVVVVLMIGSVVVAAGPPPPAEIAPSPPTPIGTTSVPTTAPNSGVTTVPQQPTGDKQPTATPSGTPSRSMPPGVPALPGTPGTTAPDSGAPSTTSPLPPAPLYEFRAPAGHKVDWAAQNISEFTVNSMPPGHKVNLYYGTKSDAKDGGGREAYGGHLLWQDGNTYGYLFWMHRTDGYFPITEYGLPAEPCVDPNRPAQGETCVIRPRTEDTGIDVLFDVNRGYRLRGVVEHRKVSPGGPDIAVTFGFYLPSPGGDWPQFPNLVGQRPLADIPYTAEQLRQVLHP